MLPMMTLFNHPLPIGNTENFKGISNIFKRNVNKYTQKMPVTVIVFLCFLLFVVVLFCFVFVVVLVGLFCTIHLSAQSHDDDIHDSKYCQAGD